MSVISMVLVVIVAFLAGMEGVLDEFQFHQPLVACTLIANHFHAGAPKSTAYSYFRHTLAQSALRHTAQIYSRY